MRLFGGERMQNMMEALNLEDDMPIENKMLTGTIESAQQKVEARNFGIRKNVLQFDDVMNRQREIIYDQRSKVLDGEDLHDNISKMIEAVVQTAVDQFIPDTDDKDDWNLDGLRGYFLGWVLTDDDLKYTDDQLFGLTREELVKDITDKARVLYAAKEEKLGSELMRELERVVLLRNVDAKWMDHIDAMDELKRGIYLRSYAQKDPVVEYRLEGFDMFEEMNNSIREDTVKMLFTIQVKTEEAPKREQVAKPTTASHGGDGDGSEKKQPIKKGKKIGRNDPCPCGSGKNV